MVESTALEMRRAGNGTVGSNPTLSATFPTFPTPSASQAVRASAADLSPGPDAVGGAGVRLEGVLEMAKRRLGLAFAVAQDGQVGVGEPTVERRDSGEGGMGPRRVQALARQFGPAEEGRKMGVGDAPQKLDFKVRRPIG